MVDLTSVRNGHDLGAQLTAAWPLRQEPAQGVLSARRL